MQRLKKENVTQKLISNTTINKTTTTATAIRQQRAHSLSHTHTAQDDGENWLYNSFHKSQASFSIAYVNMWIVNECCERERARDSKRKLYECVCANIYLSFCLVSPRSLLPKIQRAGAKATAEEKRIRFISLPCLYIMRATRVFCRMNILSLDIMNVCLAQERAKMLLTIHQIVFDENEKKKPATAVRRDEFMCWKVEKPFCAMPNAETKIIIDA